MSQTTPSAASSLLGQRYEVLETIGSGGMGMVFRARDTKIGDAVAIKQLRRDALEHDPLLLERFALEREVLERLNHPNIVKVNGAFEDSGDHYLVMELMTGGSLDRLLAPECRPLAIERVLSVGLDLSDALTRVHRLDIVHRDVKPSNVLLAADGSPRLADFGLARLVGANALSGSASVVGTLNYLCPEALQGQRLDARADLWGLGAMLFEMLTRRRPFEGQHVGSVLHAIANEAPLDLESLCPQCPSALVDLIYRLLEKDASRRVSSARQVGAELERIFKTSSSDLQTNETLGTSRRNLALLDACIEHEGPANRLPAELTPFISRDVELNALIRLISDPDVRLVTIRGPGGMGKSRLAREVARQLQSGFDGELGARAARPAFRIGLVELAPLGSADLVVPAIAAAVGLVFAAGASQKEQLLRFLAQKQWLLILDNFEHLLSSASLLSEIHAAAPNVRVLATSRESLALSHENIFELGGISGTQLFLACARRVKPNFELTPERATAIERICGLVSGMPLGITLAAAWVNLLSPAEVADEIAGSFEFLEAQLKDLPDRHRSMHAVFEHSWKLLSVEERRVFAALSVFRGGFTRTSAQCVTGATLRTLGSLLNKSLIARDLVTGRYAVHELLRQYAANQLASEPSVTARINIEHSKYYLALLAGLQQRLIGALSADACRDLDAELDNVRRAWARAVEELDLGGLDAAMEALSRFYLLRGYFVEAVSTFGATARALASASVSGGSEFARVAGLAYVLEAEALNEQWLATEALGPLEHAMKLLDAHAHPRETAFAAFTLAIVRYWLSGSSDATREALDTAERAIELYRSTNDWWGTARALITFGHFVDPIRGEECFREGIALQHANGDHSVAIPSGVTGLGIIKQEQGDRAQARAMLLESLSTSEQLKDLSARSLTLERLGILELKSGNLDEAQKYVLAWLAICRESMPFAERSCQAKLGEVLMARGLLDEAQRCFLRALDTNAEWQSGGCDAMTDALAERGLGDVDARLSRHVSAQRRLSGCLAFFERLQIPWGILFASDSLGWAACLANDVERAHGPFYRVLRLSTEWRWWPAALGALAGYAWILNLTGQAPRAVALASFVQGQPGAEYSTRRERTAPLLASIAATLTPQAFEQAVQRGRRLHLAALVRGVDRVYRRAAPDEHVSARGLRNLRTLVRNSA